MKGLNISIHDVWTNHSRNTEQKNENIFTNIEISLEYKH